MTKTLYTLEYLNGKHNAVYLRDDADLASADFDKIFERVEITQVEFAVLEIEYADRYESERKYPSGDYFIKYAI